MGHKSSVYSGVYAKGPMAMTKADLVDAIHEDVGFTKKEAAEVVELIFDIIKDTLEQGEKIKISGFGNFEVRGKRSRVGRNPQTGEVIEISARKVLTFKPSQVLKSALNPGMDMGPDDDVVDDGADERGG